jgi:hypothetical protein
VIAKGPPCPAPRYAESLGPADHAHLADGLVTSHELKENRRYSSLAGAVHLAVCSQVGAQIDSTTQVFCSSYCVSEHPGSEGGGFPPGRRAELLGYQGQVGVGAIVVRLLHQRAKRGLPRARDTRRTDKYTGAPARCGGAVRT